MMRLHRFPALFTILVSRFIIDVKILHRRTGATCAVTSLSLQSCICLLQVQRTDWQASCRYFKTVLSAHWSTNTLRVCRSRTCDRQIMRLLLYPSELTLRCSIYCIARGTPYFSEADARPDSTNRLSLHTSNPIKRFHQIWESASLRPWPSWHPHLIVQFRLFL